MNIVGIVDISKDMVGRDLGRFLISIKKLGYTVTDDPDAIFSMQQLTIAKIHKAIR